jgi:type II secretory pathway component PulC
MACFSLALSNLSMMSEKRNIADQIENDMVAISKNGVMDEIQDRREHNERRTQENLPTEPFHVEWPLIPFDLSIRNNLTT